MSESEKGHGALDKETVAQILYAFEQVRGCRGFTEDEALKVLDWASRVEAGELEYRDALEEAANRACLDLIKEGELGPSSVGEDGEVVFALIPPPPTVY